MINSPRMGRYFDMSVRDTLLRDRNHPSFTILGLLNECADKPKYLYAAGMLPLIRSLDRISWCSFPPAAGTANRASAR